MKGSPNKVGLSALAIIIFILIAIAIDEILFINQDFQRLEQVVSAKKSSEIPVWESVSNEICHSRTVERNPNWLDLIHVCYNKHHGWIYHNIDWLDDEQIDTKIKPIKIRLRNVAKEKGLYQPRHDSYESANTN